MNHSTLKTILAASGGLLSAGTCLEATAQQVETVVVTSSRLPEVNRAAAVEVIDAAEIAARNSGNLTDLLRTVPGLSLSQPGGPGGATEVFIRGAESNFTLVMVDGVKMNDPTDSRGGTFDFSSVGVDEIERIEIVRGPVSAVYGSEALAGVINVITRAGAKDSARAGAEFGTDSYARYTGRVGGQLGDRFRGSLRAQYADAGEPVPGSTLRAKSAQADVAYEVSSRLETGVGFRYAERSRTSFPDASGGPDLATLRDLEESDAHDSTLSARARMELSSQWSLNFDGSIFERDDRLSTPAIAPGVSDGRPAQTADTNFRRSNAGVSARFAPVDRFSLAFGLDSERTKGHRESVTDFGGGFAIPSDFTLKRDTNAAFVESWFRLARGLEIFASARNDWTTHADDSFSKRLGASYGGDNGLWKLRASWGEGFKLPSIYALGDSLVGNPQLREEQGRTTEIGGDLNLLAGRLTLSATGFRSVYRNLIDFDFLTFKLVNRSRAEIYGVDLSALLKGGDTWSVALHTTRTDTDLESGGSLLNRPDRTAAAVAIWKPAARWTLSSSLNYVGERAASSVPTGDVMLSSYTRVDVAATFRWTDRIDLRGAVDNVADENYEDNPGFPSPGRAVRLGVSARL